MHRIKPKRNKKTGEFSHPHTRIWTAVDRNRFKTIAFKIGNGDKRNYIDLAMTLEKQCGKIRYMCTDGYKAYGYYKIAEQHITSKAETYLVQSFNASMRGMLARLNRRTKRVSKCAEMLRLTLVMFFNKEVAYHVYL